MESLSLADRTAPLEAEDVELLGTSAYMLGRRDDLESLERAYHLHLDAGEALRAARCAFWTGMVLSIRGEMSRATGWLGRAQRLVEREPSRRAAHFAPDGECHAFPERAPSRAECLSGLEVEVIRALQALQVVGPTEHVGRRSQQLHVLRPERRRPVGERQGLQGFSPRPACIRAAAAFEGVGRAHQRLLPPASFVPASSVRVLRGLGARHGNQSR